MSATVFLGTPSLRSSPRKWGPSLRVSAFGPGSPPARGRTERGLRPELKTGDRRDMGYAFALPRRVSKVECVARPCPLPALDQRAVGLRQRCPGVAETVDDRVAAVAAEILQRHLDAGRRLPALVLGEVEHAGDLHDGLAVEAFGDDRGDRLLALDQPFEDGVEHVIGR